MIVGTPIGNLADLSPRARAALGDAQLVACEDTRRTRALASHLGLRAVTLVSLHEHNEERRTPALLARMLAGDTVALVSDAGMPVVSDPGQRLVAATARAGVPVSVVPGPSAVLGALVVSGMASERFCFEGFLPSREAARRERLGALAAEERTLVFFEAPHRLEATLEALASAFGGSRPIAMVRELTKLHEEVWRGTLAGATARARSTQPRGEHTLVVAGAAPRPSVDDGTLGAYLEESLAAGGSVKDAASSAAEALGVSRRRAYEVALVLRRGAAGQRR